jgi:hypothetical protein
LPAIPGDQLSVQRNQNISVKTAETLLTTLGSQNGCVQLFCS